MFLQAATGTQGIFQLLLPFIIMFAVFYFILLRPQQAQQKKRREMLDSLKQGDKIVTVGGIHGEITALREDYLTLKVAENCEVKISRSGVGSVIE